MNYEQPTTSYANRRNAPKTHRPTNKPPIWPKLSTNYDSIMQNKANLLDAQMNVSSILTKDYENISNWTPNENKPKQTQLYLNVFMAFEIHGSFWYHASL